MSKWKIAGLVIAVIAVTLSLINASWIAPTPQGRLLLVAHGAIGQPVRDGASGPCAAVQIRAPEHNYIENTLPSIQRAYFMGANALEIDVQRTADGQVVAFHDETLDCRTNGKGRLRDRTLAELKALDAGYGYTPDGGKTFPLRGRIGAIPTLEEVLNAAPDQRLILHFASGDPRDAEAVAAAFQRLSRPIDGKIGFTGPQPVLDRVRSLAPRAWAFDASAASPCTADYLKTGWTGFTPPSCRGATVMVPLDRQWTIWGWPNRFLARMRGADANVVVATGVEGARPLGIARPEQLGEVPRSFRGYLWVENIYDVGPSLQR
jgi:glycerophosphoryl diester phosphodiesterase